MSERLPVPEQLTSRQQEAVDQLTAGPRGAVFGPFVALLRNPELLTRVQLLGEHLRFDSAVDADLFEFVVLSVAREWDQPFEWAHHEPLARAAGLPPEVISAVGRGQFPETGRPEVRAVSRLLRALWDSRTVPDAVYEEAAELLGEPALVELVVAAGYYTTLAMVMNTALTPVTEGPALPERSS